MPGAADRGAGADSATCGGGAVVERKIGDRVFVTADNFGGPATIVATREDDARTAPASHYKVRTDTGQEFWAFDFEISEAE